MTVDENRLCTHCGFYREGPAGSKMFVYNWESDPNYGKSLCYLCVMRDLETGLPMGVIVGAGDDGSLEA